jgi:hypothetical protein
MEIWIETARFCLLDLSTQQSEEVFLHDQEMSLARIVGHRDAVLRSQCCWEIGTRRAQLAMTRTVLDRAESFTGWPVGAMPAS